MNSKLKNGLVILLKACFSFGLLAGLLYIVDLASFLESVRRADWRLLSLALGIAALNRVLMGVKWNVLARAIGARIPWTRAVSAYFASTFAGIFLPPTVGADAVRVFILSREFRQTETIISSILVERVIGLMILALFVSVGAAILPTLLAEGSADIEFLTWLTVIVAVGLILAVVFLTSSLFQSIVSELLVRIARRGAKWAKRAEFLKGIQESCNEFRNHKSAMVAFAWMTVLENLIVVFRAWLVAIAFGIDVAPLAFLVIVPVEQLLIRLPISIDGFGLREGLFMYALAIFGADPSTAFAVGLTNHVIFIVAVFPGAWLVVSYMSTRRSSITRASAR